MRTLGQRTVRRGELLLRGAADAAVPTVRGVRLRRPELGAGPRALSPVRLEREGDEAAAEIAALPLPPGPSMLESMQIGLRMSQDPLAVAEELRDRYGSLVMLRAGTVDLVMVIDPELVGRVLVPRGPVVNKGTFTRSSSLLLGKGLLTIDGAEHRRRRAALQPPFQPRHLGPYATVMHDESVRQVKEWTAGQVVDMHEEMSRLSLSIVGRSLAGVDLGEEVDTITETLPHLLDNYLASTRPDGKMRAKLPPHSIHLKRARATFDEIVSRMIDRAEAGEVDDDSILARLIAGGEYNRTDLHDDVLILLLAGYETTAAALSFVWYELDRNPEVAARLRKEAWDVLGDREGATLDDVEHLAYAKQVFFEALRKWPPGYAIDGQPSQDMRLGNYRIPKRCQLLLPVWAIHRDERWYPDPLRFDPDRHTPEATADRPRWAFFPFGGGRRVCIGAAFATMEAQIVISTIARTWAPRMADDAPEAQAQPTFTIRPRGGMPMVIEPAPQPE